MLKRILIAALWLPLAALAQSYPSPTFNNVTVQGTLTVSGGNAIGLGALAQQAANTVLANATGSTANITAFSMPSCSTSASALNWTSGSGFTCGTVATSGANSNITSLSGLTTPLSVAQGGSGSNTHAAHGVLVGEGTSAVASVVPVSAGYVLTDNGPGADPSFQTVAGLSGRLLAVTAFTSGGTWTPNASETHWYAKGCGGGGGGGGVPSLSSQYAVASGGASGSWFEHYGSGNPGSQTIAIGAPGSAGTTAGGAGGAGGATSIGSLISAPGGGGGSGGVATSAAVYINTAGAPGGATTGANLLNSNGAPGSFGVGAIGDTVAGNGANSPFGAGGLGGSGTGAGNAGTGFCAGGGGAAGSGSGSLSGGAGTKGIVIIWEFS